MERNAFYFFLSECSNVGTSAYSYVSRLDSTNSCHDKCHNVFRIVNYSFRPFVSIFIINTCFKCISEALPRSLLATPKAPTIKPVFYLVRVSLLVIEYLNIKMCIF